jgi:hypothetical protein
LPLTRIRRVQALTIAWMTVEAAVAITLGARRGSAALTGFGGDSAIELLSALLVVARFRGGAPSLRETTAARLAGALLFALALYIATTSIWNIARGHKPEASVAGIVLLFAAGVIMPMLARAKRQLSVVAHSAALRADAAQSAICAYLSWIALAGLVANAAFGAAWADAVAALCLVPFIVREGAESLRGKSCCD